MTDNSARDAFAETEENPSLSKSQFYVDSGGLNVGYIQFLKPYFFFFILILAPLNIKAENNIISKDIGEVRASLLLTSLESNDSIYLTLFQCVDTSQGAIEMNICYEKAYESYDDLLNKAYQLALSSLNLSSQEILRSSQKKWILFRNEEAKLYGKNWGYNPGSIIGTAIAIHKVAMIRERIAELSMYSHFDEQ